MIKLGVILLSFSGALTAILGITSDNSGVAIITILSALIVAINACFITSYLKHLGDHNKTVQTKSDCDSLREGIQKQLCLIIKHLGIKEDG